MTFTTSSGRVACDIEIGGVNRWDSPDFCDAFVQRAAWLDTGTELTDDELDSLTEECRGEIGAHLMEAM